MPVSWNDNGGDRSRIQSREGGIEMREKLEFIGTLLLLSLSFAIFILVVFALGIVATWLLYRIGILIGLGQDVFMRIFQIIATWKAWDAVAWVIGKIANRKEVRNE